MAEDVQKGVSGFCVHRVERFVEQQEFCVLRKHPRKQYALELAVGKVTDLPVGEFRHFYPFECLHHAFFLRRIHAAEKADFVPQTHGGQFKYRHRLAAVDVGLLRQVGDVAAGDALPYHFARIAFEQPHHGLEQGGFSRAVGAENRPHRGIVELHVHMVYRRFALVADGQVFDCDHDDEVAQK